MMNIKELHQKLIMKLVLDVMEACLLFDGSITSFGRSIKHNKSCRGENTSWHLDFLAFDMILDHKLKSTSFQEFMKNKGYRVLYTGKEVNICKFHIQYNWPVFIDYKRENELSHLKEMVKRYPDLFKKFGEIEI